MKRTISQNWFWPSLRNRRAFGFLLNKYSLGIEHRSEWRGTYSPHFPITITCANKSRLLLVGTAAVKTDCMAAHPPAMQASSGRQEWSVLPLQSVKARECGELWREKCTCVPWIFTFLKTGQKQC